jgi:hypothetical protein
MLARVGVAHKGSHFFMAHQYQTQRLQNGKIK